MEGKESCLWERCRFSKCGDMVKRAASRMGGRGKGPGYAGCVCYGDQGRGARSRGVEPEETSWQKQPTAEAQTANATIRRKFI